ncbi:MAG: hypothetical protein Q7Q71_10535 [Verrucomicrobiota bacterium JB023]|nr:hypothetical protein [Verrucomicrobiota bacterium JB023]
MFKSLLIIIFCGCAGYVAYPYINEKTGSPKPTVALLFLNDVSETDLVGSWLLSPRAVSKINPNLSLSGRRTGLSLESWGGGNASFNIGAVKLDGPINWELIKGKAGESAYLKVTSRDDTLYLKFTEKGGKPLLVAEGKEIVPDLQEQLFFVRAN